MKKRLYAILSLVLLAVFATGLLAACDDGKSDQSGNNLIKSEYDLQMGKKYIRSSDTNKKIYEQEYVLFRANGTGELRHFYVSESSPQYNNDYIIQFKYIYADGDKSTVVCFFDSVTYGSKHSETEKVSSDWSKLLSVSKNVITNVGSNYIFFINEDYLNDLPNFGK